MAAQNSNHHIQNQQTILLVENHPGDPIMFQNAFTVAKLPHRLEQVLNGQEAIHYISGADKYADRNQYPRPALVLLDLYVSQVDGFKLLKWRNRQPDLASLPVVVLSQTAHDISRAYQLGANSFLVKPIDVAALREAINCLIIPGDRTPRIVVIDDDEDVRPVTVNKLRREFPDAIIEQAGCKEGIEHVLNGGAYDVVISDVHAPDWTRLDNLHAIKTRRSNTSVILYSKKATEQDLLDAFQAGVDNYVLNVADGDHRLTSAVRTALGRAWEQDRQLAAASQWRTSFDAVPHAIFQLDNEQHIVFSNRAMQGMAGLGVEQVNGRFCWEVIHHTNAPCQNCVFLRMKASHHREVQEVCKGNQWTVVTADPIYAEDGTMTGAVHIMTDITKRKLAEQALRKDERLLHLFLEHSPVALAMLDKELKFIIVSRRWLSEFNLKAGNLIGHSYYDVFPQTSKRWRDIHQRCLAGAEESGEAEPIPRADGSLDWMRWDIRPWYEGEGEVGGIIMFSEMITERKRAEEAINNLKDELEERVRDRTMQLEIANKELETFSYSVSHDLRAPLRSIEGFSQRLMEDYANQLDEAGLDALKRIRRSSQHMAHLIEDLLKLSRIGRSEMVWKSVDLTAMAVAVSADLQHTLPERSVEWIIQPGLVVMGDGTLLQIALENLLGNAWKFSGKRDRARIEFGTVSPASIAGEAIGERETIYFVKDNGAGFDMAFAHKLFVVFQRLHSEEQFPGTGVGLSTVQRIILRHGGRIWAEGQLDQGATFYFTLG